LPLAAVACSVQAPPGIVSKSPDNKTRQLIRERLSAVVVTESKNFSSWSHQKFAIEKAPKDADGGSAAPIAEDGYFLTADHVLAEADAKSVYVIYANGGKAVARSARILWRSAKDDLALLHVPISTPYYYQWSDPRLGIPKGYPVIHGGMSTGSRSAPGVVRTALSPENFLTGHRAFKMDIPLEPGDSGGPVVDAYGRLVGVNSAVEFLVPMETAIFMDSEGIRPNTRKIQFIIDSDRHSRQSH
jgi:S1-C subfamily serine protease